MENTGFKFESRIFYFIDLHISVPLKWDELNN